MLIDVGKSVQKGGFLDRWLEYSAEFEFPDSYALFSLLAVASAAVNGRILINPDSEPSPLPNLFVVLYGPSGSRKGSAIRQALWLLGEAVPDTPVLPDDFTMEALGSELANQSKKNEKCGGLIVQEEFADLIGGPDYALRNSKFLTKLWDARVVYTRLTHAHGAEAIKNPYVTLLGSSSPDWLEKTDPRTLAGGFLRRLLMVVEYGAKRQNASPKRNEQLFGGLAKAFGTRLGRNAFRPGRMVLSKEAFDFMEQWYNSTVRETWRNADERAGHFASCMQAHTLKVGSLVNLLEGHGAEVMALSSLQTSSQLVESLLPSLFQAYASLVPTPYAKLRAVILRSVQNVAPNGLSAAALDKAVVQAAGVKPKDASEARLVLTQQKILVVRDNKLYFSGG